MGTTVFRIRIELIFRRCWNLVTPSRSCRGRAQVRALFPVNILRNIVPRRRRSVAFDESEEPMRTNRPAYVAAEMNRIVADEEAFERLVDLFKQAHGRAPASDCEAYQWAAGYELAKIKHLLRNFFLQLDIWQTTCRFFAHSHLANLRHRLDDGSSIEPAASPCAYFSI
jgi:hypothetical protein